MKKLLYIALFVIGSTITAQEKTKIGEFLFEKETIDYGVIVQNSDGKRTFTFKNIGNAPIQIDNVKATCGCTVPTKPEKPIMPGETAEISVEYDTRRLGGFSKSITITSNATDARKVIRIKGTILKDDSNLNASN